VQAVREEREGQVAARGVAADGYCGGGDELGGDEVVDQCAGLDELGGVLSLWREGVGEDADGDFVGELLDEVGVEEADVAVGAG